MTRNARQRRIIELIRENEIDTQEELVSLLQQSQFNVTQATVSRDIKDLGLIKTQSVEGKYKYTLVENVRRQTMGKFGNMFREAVVSMTVANNLLVVKTVSGTANTAAAFIDSMGFDNVLGTIAGDDTILIICRTEDNANSIVGTLETYIG